MSLIQEATVQVFLADYAGVDGSMKLNIIGAGVIVLGQQPGGLTAPFSVAVRVTLPGSYAGIRFALGLSLWNARTNTEVQVPGPTGRSEALRIQQVLSLESISVPGIGVVPEMPVNFQQSVNLGGGLPLAAGEQYFWRADLDGQRKPGWRADFYVIAGPVAPVLGGRSGDPEIEGGLAVELDDPIEDVETAPDE